MGSSRSEEHLWRINVAASFDLLAPRRGIEKDTHRAELKQSKEKYIQFRCHRVKDERRISRYNSPRIKPSCDSGRAVIKIADCECALATVTDVDDGGRERTYLGLVSHQLHDIHAHRSLANKL